MDMLPGAEEQDVGEIIDIKVSIEIECCVQIKWSYYSAYELILLLPMCPCMQGDSVTIAIGQVIDRL
jgi:hypothetical protein